MTQLLGDPAATDFDIAPLRNDRGIQSRRRGAEVRLSLAHALAEEPPPSVSEVARRLHFARSERLYQIDRAIGPRCCRQGIAKLCERYSQGLHGRLGSASGRR